MLQHEQRAPDPQADRAPDRAAPKVAWNANGHMTVPQLLAKAVARWPDKIAFDVVGETITYRQLDQAVNRLAHGLIALGVEKGQPVVTLLDNSMDAILIFYALARIGAVGAPVNTSYKGEFLRHQVCDTGAFVLIAESDYADRLIAIEQELPTARTLLYRGERPVLSSHWDTQSLDSIRTENIAPIEADIAPGDLALLIYTSGTTGPSKGCMMSHNYAVNFAQRVSEGIALTEEDVMWSPTPLFHANAITAAVLSGANTGATVAIYPRFSVSRFWPEIERTKATVVSLLGAMIPLLATAAETDAEKRCRGQLRLALGAPFGAQVKQIWHERFGVRDVGSPGYGMTECCPMTYHPVTQPSPPGTSGRVFADFDTRIVDDDGNECPPGVAGEIITRPNRPHIMFSGYWRRPDATCSVNADLWFHTGDIGRIDADGFFSFVDRKKDYLRRGGENISSFEMETAFRAHPDIEDVAVHAVPSDLSEDEVKVTAVLRQGAVLDEEGFCRWTIERVPYFAVPRYIEFRSDLPRNPVGRVLKYELRAEGVTPGTWDRSKSSIVFAKR